MSSNIGPEASTAYEKYLDAKSIEDKIKRLEEFLSLLDGKRNRQPNSA